MVELNKYLDHFYKRDWPGKENLSYFKLLRKYFPKIDLTYNKKLNLIYSKRDLLTKRYDLPFHIKTAIRNKEFMVSFYFRIYFGDDVTYYVNLYNFIAEPGYRAYIGTNGESSYYVTIEYYINIQSIYDALREFKKALDYIIRGLGMSALSYVYDTYGLETLKTKEMN